MARQISWQVIVDNAGTAVAGPNIVSHDVSRDFYIEALPTNGGLGYVGNTGEDTVGEGTGFVMVPGQVVSWNGSNLNEIWFDVETGNDGDGFCIFMV